MVSQHYLTKAVMSHAKVTKHVSVVGGLIPVSLSKSCVPVLNLARFGVKISQYFIMNAIARYCFESIYQTHEVSQESGWGCRVELNPSIIHHCVLFLHSVRSAPTAESETSSLGPIVMYRSAHTYFEPDKIP